MPEDNFIEHHVLSVYHYYYQDPKYRPYHRPDTDISGFMRSGKNTAGTIILLVIIAVVAVLAVKHYMDYKNTGIKTSAAETGGNLSAEEQAPSDTPSATETPASTEAPVPTETPASTETPAPTETPALTETPAPTETTALTKAPASTETTAPTKAPASTETAAPTKTPAPKKTPRPTKTPAPTKTPTPSPTPTPEPTPEPVVYLGDLYAIPAETVVAEETIDMNNIDQYFTAYPIDDNIFARIYGDDRSFKTYCTLSTDELRYIKLLYRGFDLQTHVGELMVNTLLADEIIYIFKTLYLYNYQIERIVLVDNYGADDSLSIEHNNTSAFNYRAVTGGTTPSTHAYGFAIDINPINNPYIMYDEYGNPYWEDPDAWLYLDRDAPDAYERHMINYNDLCYQLFHEFGWTWGGDWLNPRDYQHFEKVLY